MGEENRPLAVRRGPVEINEAVRQRKCKTDRMARRYTFPSTTVRENRILIPVGRSTSSARASWRNRTSLIARRVSKVTLSFAPPLLFAVAVMFALPSAGGASQSFDGTAERFSHGQFVVRSFDDCKMYYLSIPPRATNAEARTLGNEIRFVLQRRQNVHVVASDDNLWIVEISPSERSGDADKKCVTNLGTNHVDGTVTAWSRGNAGASMTIRIAGGHTIDFGWTYRVDDPKISPRLELVCDSLGMTCHPRHLHVRVTYKTQVTGDGSALVPVSIVPI